MTQVDPIVSAPLPSAREEWRAAWQLPFVAMLGIAGASTFSYSSGVFLIPITREFGWTRAAFSLSLPGQIVLLVFVAPFVGRLVDRIGPRRIALAGIIPYTLAFAALGLANGSIVQWVLLCLLQGITTLALSPVIWLSAVVGRFHTSRGMALAVAQAGLGLATAIWPATAAFFIQTYGWRPAFGLLAIVWFIPMMPMVYFFFYGARDLRAGSPRAKALPPPPTERAPLARMLLSRTFICLILAGALFSSVSLGMMLHLVPLLQSNGFSLVTAAWIASVAGLATLSGRLFTGLLLDRFPAKIVGIITFLVPIMPVLLLWNYKGSLQISLAAVIVFGFTAGAESDVVAYIASRLLPPGAFASGYAIIMAAFAIVAGMGPLVASRLFDVYGSYDPFLLLIIPIMILGAVLLATLPRIAPPHRSVRAH